ncbi:hypothetical protein EVAR_22132_1 [Eumeta japonica]|uniref:Uncharacterized protein n=1 Tax=Eumeta variegata TaxID=151549 RepID=A0A4C1VYY4_EUMVA|nr:hypothetical protein EVAR_22132_1 [Eumeta japonica]
MSAVLHDRRAYYSSLSSRRVRRSGAVVVSHAMFRGRSSKYAFRQAYRCAVELAKAGRRITTAREPLRQHDRQYGRTPRRPGPVKAAAVNTVIHAAVGGEPAVRSDFLSASPRK